MSDIECGRRADGFRINCQLPRGHVKTATDWHEGKADIHDVTNTTAYSYERTATELIRWAPELFEIPRSERDE